MHTLLLRPRCRFVTCTPGLADDGRRQCASIIARNERLSRAARPMMNHRSRFVEEEVPADRSFQKREGGVWRTMRETRRCQWRKYLKGTSLRREISFQARRSKMKRDHPPAGAARRVTRAGSATRRWR